MNKVVVILGPTASGKTKLAVRLAREFNGEIVSADSRQVYRGFDVGSGKDLDDYIIKVKNQKSQVKSQIRIPYHLIDVASPKRQFTLARYQKLAFKAIEQIFKKGKLPIVVGGSGLYLQCLIDNYQLSYTAKPDLKLRRLLAKLSLTELQIKFQKLLSSSQHTNKPEFVSMSHEINESDWKNKRRLIRYLEIVKAQNAATRSLRATPLKRESEANSNMKLPHRSEYRVSRNNRYSWLLIGLNPGQEVLQAKIKRRINQRLKKEDMVGEVRRLRLPTGRQAHGLSWQRLENFGLEYKFIAKYLQGKLTYKQMNEQLYSATCRFAKRQLTWFKRMNNFSHPIFWLNNYTKVQEKVKDF